MSTELQTADLQERTGRRARMERTTSESSVLVEIDLDGTGRSDISSSVPFYDHML